MPSVENFLNRSCPRFASTPTTINADDGDGGGYYVVDDDDEFVDAF